MLKAKHSAYAFAFEGTFLARSMWLYDRDVNATLSPEVIGFLRVCKHQVFCSYEPTLIPRMPLDEAYKALYLTPREALEHGVDRLLEYLWYPPEPTNYFGLPSVIHRAFQQAGGPPDRLPAHGHCPYCATDFVVIVNPDEVYVAAVQDCGSEGGLVPGAPEPRIGRGGIMGPVMERFLRLGRPLVNARRREREREREREDNAGLGQRVVQSVAGGLKEGWGELKQHRARFGGDGFEKQKLNLNYYD